MVRSLFVSTTFIFVMEPSVELPTRDCVVPKTVDQKKIEQRLPGFNLGSLRYHPLVHPRILLHPPICCVPLSSFEIIIHIVPLQRFVI